MRASSIVGCILLTAAPVFAAGWILGELQHVSSAQQQTANWNNTQTAKVLVDINTASLARLKALPGFGDAYARRVIEGRPYTAKNQLVTRGVLPLEAYERVAPFIIAHRMALRK